MAIPLLGAVSSGITQGVSGGLASGIGGLIGQVFGQDKRNQAREAAYAHAGSQALLQALEHQQRNRESQSYMLGGQQAAREADAAADRAHARSIELQERNFRHSWALQSQRIAASLYDSSLMRQMQKQELNRSFLQNGPSPGSYYPFENAISDLYRLDPNQSSNIGSIIPMVAPRGQREIEDALRHTRWARP